MKVKNRGNFEKTAYYIENIEFIELIKFIEVIEIIEVIEYIIHRSIEVIKVSLQNMFRNRLNFDMQMAVLASGTKNLKHSSMNHPTYVENI